MSRIRTLKPEFFRSESLARCSRDARLTFQGLWCEADDAGRGVANPRVLKGALWPFDDDITHDDVEAHLRELADTGHIRLYETDGKRYYEIVRFTAHQAAAYRRGTPIHPAPPTEDTREITSSDVESCRRVQTRADACESVLEHGTGNMEHGSSPAPEGPKQADLFGALCDTLGLDPARLTRSQRSDLGKTARELTEARAAPEQIPKFARWWNRTYPEAKLTHRCYRQHWAGFTAANNGNGARAGPPIIERCTTCGHLSIDCRCEPEPVTSPR